MKKYRAFDHTADLGIEVHGKDEVELFENAGMAVHDMIIDLRNVEPRQSRRIAVEGRDREDLLVNFLREILYMFNGERWVLKTLSVRKTAGGGIAAKLEGEPFDPGRHGIRKEIKAVTYHQVQVAEGTGGWKARVIFDV